MNKLIRSILILILIGNWVNGQTLEVKDSLTQFPIYDVIISDTRHQFIGKTNVNGIYNFKFKNADNFILNHPDYQRKSISVSSNSNKKHNIVFLQPKGFDLEALTIKGLEWQSKKNKSAVSTINISKDVIQFHQPQTTADALSVTGEVYVQKSQLGGGSPMIRGFAANRVIIIADGIRMNNAIFRSGNVHNVIGIDPFTLANAQVIMGPGSVLYGSDAIGGVLRFNTEDIKPSEKFKSIGKATAKYATANQEKTIHTDLSLSNKLWSSFTSFTYSDFNDLKMGMHGPKEYLSKHYVQRKGGKDILIENSNPLIQKFSGYNQWNLLQKLKWKPNAGIDLNYTFSYAKTSKVPRYDRLNIYRNHTLRYAEWYYGPQQWIQNALSVNIKNNYVGFDEFSSVLSHQYFSESRHNRNFNSDTRNNKYEKVNVWAWDNEFYKKIDSKHHLLYGWDMQFNHVDSRGNYEHIVSGKLSPATSRYPNHSTLNQWGIYVQEEWKVNPNCIIETGFRYSWIHSFAKINTNIHDFPFEDANLKNRALSGSIGTHYRLSKDLKLSASFSTGFRAPNIDDIAKIFDSEPGNVVIPNPNLNPEYIYTLEGGISKSIGNRFLFHFNAYHSWLIDALVRKNFVLNGSNYIMYDNELSRIQAIQNASEALVYGSLFSMEWKISQAFLFMGNINYTHGEEKLDSGGYVPLRHAAPLFGRLAFSYNNNYAKVSLLANYNGKIKAKDLPPNEKAKGYLYAKNANGNPYAPAFMVFDFQSQWKINHHLTLHLGLENILDKRYRPYASGISAPGRNFVISVKSLF